MMMCGWKLGATVVMIIFSMSSVHTRRLDADYVEGSGDSEPLQTTEMRIFIGTTALESTGRFRQLQADIKELLQLIPASEVRERIRAHIQTDSEVRAAYTYLRSDDFRWLLKNYVFGAPEFQAMELWLLRFGLSLEELLGHLLDVLDLSSKEGEANESAADGIQWSESLTGQTTIGGMSGLLEDVLTLIPRDELFLVFLDKLDSSTEFANLVECFGSAEFGQHVEQLQKSTKLRKASIVLSKHKIDFRKIIALVPSYFLFG